MGRSGSSDSDSARRSKHKKKKSSSRRRSESRSPSPSRHKDHKSSSSSHKSSSHKKHKKHSRHRSRSRSRSKETKRSRDRSRSRERSKEKRSPKRDRSPSKRDRSRDNSPKRKSSPPKRDSKSTPRSRDASPSSKIGNASTKDNASEAQFEEEIVPDMDKIAEIEDEGFVQQSFKSKQTNIFQHQQKKKKKKKGGQQQKMELLTINDVEPSEETGQPTVNTTSVTGNWDAKVTPASTDSSASTMSAPAGKKSGWDIEPTISHENAIFGTQSDTLALSKFGPQVVNRIAERSKELKKLKEDDDELVFGAIFNEEPELRWRRWIEKLKLIRKELNPDEEGDQKEEGVDDEKPPMNGNKNHIENCIEID